MPIMQLGGWMYVVIITIIIILTLLSHPEGSRLQRQKADRSIPSKYSNYMTIH